MTRRGSHITAALVAAAVASVGNASVGESSAIDLQLEAGIDFRSYAYAECLDKPVCTVGDITIHAERLNEATNLWEPAQLYWDPIDGIGVRDGAQNDEIDFDERIRVAFNDPVSLTGIWISDLFHTEDGRYGSSGTERVEGVPEDTEVAAMTLWRDGAQIGSYTTIAADRLPWQPFNQEVSNNLIEDGDLRRRVVINDEVVTLVVPGPDRNETIKQILRLGQIDKDKKSIFDGLETVEIDLSSILFEFQNAPLFTVGTRNFEIVRDWAQSEEATRQIRIEAESKRTSIDVSNGEIRWEIGAPVEIDAITFVVPFDASNDYSIAGILLAPTEQRP